MAVSYVLVVDDDPQITTLLRVVLGRGGWQVGASHSGAQALAMARRCWCRGPLTKCIQGDRDYP